METPTVVYKLNPSIRSKLFNYTETVDSINAEEREGKHLVQVLNVVNAQTLHFATQHAGTSSLEI